MDFWILNAVAVIGALALAVAARVAALDAAARGRGPLRWGLVVLLLGPLGWTIFGVVAALDWMRRRGGLLAVRRLHPALAAAAVVAVLTLGTSVWLAATPVSIPVGSLSDPERFGGDLMPGECGAPAAVVARLSVFPAPSDEPAGADERELARRRQACLQVAGQRVTAAWELLAVAALLGVWGAAEAHGGALARAEVGSVRLPG